MERANTKALLNPQSKPRSLHDSPPQQRPSGRDDIRDIPLPHVPQSANVVYHVYILANPTGVLYTGVTNYLERRVAQHKQKLIPGFTKKYDVARLVYFETFGDVRNAISREKQIKGWRREKKLALIRKLNSTFRDLSEDFPH